MIQEKAYAKVNLHLQVVGKREDGYHLLETLFAKVNLYDTVYVEFIRDKDIEIIVEGEKIAKEKNLAYIAGKWYLSRYRIKKWGASIVIKKNVPIGSGLGGGSSNAASVIRAFLKFFKERDPNLIKDSATLGADIPFLLSDHTLAIGKGVGEILEPIESERKRNYKITIIYPNLFVSTKEVFDKFDEMEKNIIQSNPPIDANFIKEIASSFDVDIMKEKFFNHLEKACFSLKPEIKKLKEGLKKITNGFVFMTGSGSSVCVLTERDERVPVEKLDGLGNFQIYEVDFL